jgi:hypothetical protein
MKHLLLILTFPVLLFPVFCFAQGDQTIINVPINGSGGTEKAILHLPDDYGQTTTRYPLLVFLHGIGEGSLTDPSTIYNSSAAGGPAYIIAHGSWPSSFVNPVDKKSYKYIVVCPQAAYGTSTTAPALEVILSYLVKTYRVDESRLYLTGISAGGEGVLEYTGKIQASGAGVSATHKVAALIPMSAVMNAYYRGQYADTIVKNNVQLWGFGSATDVHGANTLNLVLDANADKANYALSTAYSGGHCCWEQFYDPNYRLNGKSIYEWALQYTQGVSAPPSTTPSAPAVNPSAVPGKVEAEAYATMSGVATESTADAGGGSDVGWIDQGDYMDYSVNVAAAGQYSIGFRVATPNAGASFQLTKTDGTVLATVKVPNTGGYQTWQTATVTVTLAAGVQTLRIKSTAAPIWNINWMQFTQSVSTPTGISIPGTIQAESYSAMSGIGTETTGDTGGGQDVGWLDNGDWMDYAVNVTTAGRYTANFRIATPNVGASFQVLTSSGVVLSTVTVPITGGYQTWQNVSVTLNLPAGSQTLRIKSTGSSIWNINWWQVTANNTLPAAVSIPGTIQAESYSAMSGIGTETTGDAGGGLDVGWVDNGDYMDYAVNVTAAGVYTASFRTSAPAAGATLQVLNSSGTVLTTVKVPNTAAFTTWQTVTANITLPAGNQTLRIRSAALPHWNINWIQLAKAAAGTAATVGTQSGMALQMGADSTAENLTSNLVVFPNPVHDQLTIRINNEQTGNMLVQLTDAYGAIRGAYNFSKTAGFTQVNLSTSNLTSGVYFVRIQIGNRSEIRKIIKL